MRVTSVKDICIKLGIDAYNLINQSAQAYSRHAMSLHAAALAYRLLFSVFPFIVFLFSLLSFFAVPAFFGWIRDQAVPFLPHALKRLVHLERVSPTAQILDAKPSRCNERNKGRNR